MLSTRLATLALLCSIPACGPATPRHMSTAGHEASADLEDRAAARHASDDDDDDISRGEATEASAGSCGSSASAAILGTPCWATEDDHPGEDRIAAIEEHRSLAAAHRAAAADLRQAEARACVGLSDDDRDVSPFAHHADVSSVAELRETVPGSEATERLAGATIVFRAVRGLTSAWLERVLECHLARNASLGHDVPEMAECPLVPAGVTVNVRRVAGSFAVDIRAAGDAEAAEVLRRARTLVPAS